jgi:gamma-glutamylcyclotransferase (GGCT)/AIG2-like uncharacterized protein YtfP
MLIALGLDQFAYVYTPNEVDGAYTVLAEAALPCRLVAKGASAIDNRRVELANDGLLLWGPDYVMPETARVLVNGTYYNVEAGTLAAIRNLSSVTEYRRCEVRRATGTGQWALGVTGASELGQTTIV